MHHIFKHASLRLLLALLIILSSAACSAAPAPTTAPVVAEASATAVPATEVPEPTATNAPTATAEPTATATALPTATEVPTATPTTQPTLGMAQEGGLSAWCRPEDVSVSVLQKPLEPPATARVGEIVDGALEINNLPVSDCIFIYTFNQPAPEGLKLQVYEVRGKQPWLTADLQPVEGKPEALMVSLHHTYIVAPPLWNVSYQFSLVDASGTEIRRDPVNLHRWTPELCWNGRPPNPLTLRCPLAQDLHPWDAGYGTPVPTAPPED